MFLIYSILTLLSLFTINFFVKVFLRNEKVSIWSALASSSFSLILISQLVSVTDKINTYTLIPMYLLFHLIICLFFSTFIFYILIMPMLFLNEFIGIIKPLKFFFIFDVSIKIPGSLTNFIDKINKIFNPLYGTEISKFNQNRMIKSIFLLSYLISGIIILSPITNYISNKGLDTTIESFKRDYDLYKTVFVTSLIPFTLKYLLNFGDKNIKNE